MDQRKMPKKSPSGAVMGSSGTSLPEYNVSVPCFPTPTFSAQSHVRHAMPQIPTRAGHPRMAVSKASTRDPFMGRMFEGESFADVITTHKLDDSLEQTHFVTKERHDDLEFSDTYRPENHKASTSGGVKNVSAEHFVNTSVDMKGRKPLLLEEDDDDHTSPGFTHSASPSHFLNIGETAKNSSRSKSPTSDKFVRQGEKGSKDMSLLVGSLKSGKSLKQSKQSSSVGSMLDVHSFQCQSKYLAKSRNPGKPSLFPMFDDSDSDDNGSRQSPVAMNLSLAAKSPLRSSAATESLPKFPGAHRQAVNRDNFGGSPLDAIMQMTHMINTSQSQSPSFSTSTDTVIPANSFPHQFSTSVSSFQPGSDAWSQGTRIFGSGSSPGPSYGKIAAEGGLKLPGSVKASDPFDGTEAMSPSNMLTHTMQTTDALRDSSSLQSLRQTSQKKSDGEGAIHSQVCDGSPIKLKIRRGTRGDNSQVSIVTSKPSNEAKPDDVILNSGESPAMYQPSPLALSLLGVSPSPGLAPTGPAKPAAGRAKTKGELKKQLFERKEQRLRADGSQASSPAGSTMTPSPSHSHADTLSPLTVNVDGSLSTPQPSPQLSAGKTAVTVTTSPTENTSAMQYDPNAAKWKLGDMLWAKVSGHPWWPCIVLPDPGQSSWCKPLQRRQNAMLVQYHVRFYGEENERGWVPETSVIKFRGRKAFDNYAERMVAEHRRDRKSFAVSSSRKRAWDLAVSEATKAHTLPRRQRIEAWMSVSDLQIPPDCDDNPEQDSVEDSNSVGRYRHSPKCSSKAKRSKIGDRLNIAGLSRMDDTNLPKSVPNQKNAQFAVFCQKRRMSLRSENPEMSNEDIDLVLVDEWKHLDAKTRARYIPMGSDVIHLSDVMVSPTPKTSTDGQLFFELVIILLFRHTELIVIDFYKLQICCSSFIDASAFSYFPPSIYIG